MYSLESVGVREDFSQFTCIPSLDKVFNNTFLCSLITSSGAATMKSSTYKAMRNPMARKNVITGLKVLQKKYGDKDNPNGKQAHL